MVVQRRGANAVQATNEGPVKGEGTRNVFRRIFKKNRSKERPFSLTQMEAGKETIKEGRVRTLRDGPERRHRNTQNDQSGNARELGERVDPPKERLQKCFELPTDDDGLMRR